MIKNKFVIYLAGVYYISLLTISPAQSPSYPPQPGAGGGTVTAVGVTAPSDLLSVSGSPVSTSGTIGLSKPTNTAQGAFYGGPSSGTGAAAFRNIVLADMTAALGNITGDCVISTTIICAKTNGVSFAASATTDTTNPANIKFTQTGTGAIQRTVQAKLLENPISPEDFNASHSMQNTTGTGTASSTTLTLATALDFANGQGIRIDYAGAAPSVSAPTSMTITPTGTPGTTQYCYRIVALDGLGGGVPSAQFCTSTANASMSSTNYNALSWSGGSSNLYAVYGGPSGAEVLVQVTAATQLNDFGTSYTGYIFTVDWLPYTVPTSSWNDYLVTTIVSGAGTTTLTLASALTTSVSGKFVGHDDTVALQAAMNASLGVGYVNLAGGQAQYPITGKLSDINYSYAGVSMIGHGHSTPATDESYYATADTQIVVMGGFTSATSGAVLVVGSQGTGNGYQLVDGGVLADFDITLRGLAWYGLQYFDATSNYNRITVTGALASAFDVTNTNTIADVTRDQYFDHSFAHEWGVSSNYGNCYSFRGTNSVSYPNAGVTMPYLFRPYCDRELGNDIYIGQIADAGIVERPWDFRPAYFPESPFVNWAYTTGGTNQAVNGTWDIRNPQATGPIYVASPIDANGSSVELGLDTADSTNNNNFLIYGPGKYNVRATSINGQLRGIARTSGLRNVSHFEAGTFFSFNSGSNLLTTRDGTYGTGGTTYTGGYIGTSGSATANPSNGGFSITTPATAGDYLFVSEAPPSGTGPYTFPTGVALGVDPTAIIDMTNVTQTNMVTRAGFICDTNDPPHDGIYVEANSSNTDYMLVVRSNSTTQASVDAGVALSNVQWSHHLDIDYADGVAVLKMRMVNLSLENNPVYANVGNANMPTITKGCPLTMLIKTTTAASATMFINSWRDAWQVD